MTKLAPAVWVFAGLLVAGPRALAGQFPVGVLPRGSVSLSVGGVSQHAPADARLDALLAPSTVPELAALQTGLAALFAATDTSGGTRFRLLPSDVALGGARAGYTADRSALVLGLAAGITRRVTVFARVPLEQYAPVPPRVAVGAALGANPDTVGNRALLAALGPEYAALGAAPYLPVASSRVGAELVSRVRARTGGTLRLPTAPLPETGVRALLTERGYAPGAAGDPEVQTLSLGDVEAGVRFELLKLGPGLAGADSVSARGVRALLEIAAIVPTASETPPAVLLDAPWNTGGTVARARLAGDVFWTQRWTAAFSAGAALGGARQVLVQDGDASGPFGGVLAERVVERAAVSRASWEAAPRFRLTRTITLGGWYVGALGFGGDAGATQVHAVGAQAAFSTLPILREARVLPLEFSLGMLRAVAGEPRGTQFSVEGRTVVRAWGAR